MIFPLLIGMILRDAYRCVFPILLAPFFCSLDARKLVLGCYWKDCVPERNFHVQDWQIPPGFFPLDAKVSGLMISSDNEGAIEQRSQNIFWDNDGRVGASSYNIYRYITIKESSEQYKRILNRISEDTAWNIPDEVTFSSTTADEIFIGCGTQIFYECNMLARYQEYIIYFSMAIDEKMMYSEFQDTSIYLDEQISSRLYP